jgi:putative photosynthetic complex assembly protein 2
MSPYVGPVLFTAFVWWFATGLILFLDRLSPRTFPWSFAGTTVLAAAALYGLAESRSHATVAGAYCAFACAVGVWGWIEMSFLTGFVTGPRRHGCPAGCSGWAHFTHGVAALLYHELAIALLSVAVLGLTWGGPNRVGAWAFIVLWGMQESAKLNLFLGVVNLGESFLPPHLAYLGSFFRRRRMNALLPVSVAVGAGLAVFEGMRAADPSIDAFGRTGATLLATLLALGAIEHVALVVPVRIERLWRMLDRAPATDDTREARSAVPIRARIEEPV